MSPFLIVLAVIALVALVAGARAWLGYRQVDRDAREDHGYRTAHGMRGSEFAVEDYIKAYRRVHAPRGQLGFAVAMAAIVVLTPLLLRLADAIMTGVWILSGRDRTFEPTFLVYQFGIFFLLIVFWATIALLAAQRFHGGTVERVEHVLYGDPARAEVAAMGSPFALIGIMTILVTFLGVLASVAARVLF